MSPAARLLACPRFRWLPGMRVTRPDGALPIRIVTVDPFVASHESGDQFCTGTLGTDVPDLTDPATLGCLLALVRESAPNAYAEFRIRTWTVWQPHYDPTCFSVPTIITLGTGPTEAEALVVALDRLDLV